MKTGALPYQAICVLLKSGNIKGGDEANIQPASLDLTISSEIYRIEYIFQPRPKEPIHNILKDMGATRHDLANPLERGVMYLVKLQESLELPDELHGRCNPKSSTGRNDLQVRVVADGIPRFETVTEGFNGALWMVISPKSFPIKLTAGESLSQIRFFYHDVPSRLTEAELQDVLERDKLLWKRGGQEYFRNKEIKIKDNDGSIILTVDIAHDNTVAWECLGLNRVLDFSKKNHYSPHDFFRAVSSMHGRIHLKQGGFYILQSRERVCVPPQLSSEMIPMDERSGEFRSHYAGFIDPGWGWGIDGKGNGRAITLEVRPFEDLVLRDNQPIAKITFDKMHERPEITYDGLERSHYTEELQQPKLSKHFVTLRTLSQ